MHKMDVFKTPQKVNIYLGYFCKKVCHQELSKIAQSRHTDCWISLKKSFKFALDS